MDPIIQLRDVVKIYKSSVIRFLALKGVTLDIYKEEFVAIVGKSGSGKSTLLHVAAGLTRPSSGRIVIRGLPIHRMSEKELVDFRLRNIGYVFQNYNLFESMTALENVIFPLMLAGISIEDRKRKAVELLKQFELEDHLSHYPNQLSGGQQQRVAIARAIIGSPSILFADEPTGNLDSQSSLDVILLLRKLCKENHMTLLLVTHDPEKAAFADRIITIKDGCVSKTEMNTNERGTI